MKETETADEMRSRCIRQMKQPLGDVYFYLWQEVAGLHLKWTEYTKLYGTNPNRINLLNKTAPMFFIMVQHGLWESIMLNIARLTDKASSRGQANLSVKQLPKLIQDCNLRTKIERLIQSADDVFKFCQNLRNKEYAHRDLDIVLGKNPSPLVASTQQQIEEKIYGTLDVLVNILDTISIFYFDTSSRFDLPSPPGGVEVLMDILERHRKKPLKVSAAS